MAFPSAKLVGVDYSLRSSGIHHPDFDEIWLQRPWNEIDLGVYQDDVRATLHNGALWISGLDLEVHWFASVLSDQPGILIPSTQALRRSSKPSFSAAARLPVVVPESIGADESAFSVYSFCRRHGWPIWCKGPFYEARRAWSWEEVETAISELRETWPSPSPTLQAHLRGAEESIAFAAYGGRLLDCVAMIKRFQTPEGKTWSGRVEEVDAVFKTALARALKSTRWTGGAELEFVRTEDGVLHLIDWNPRFPAWVYGATLAGHNLPAALVEEAVGERAFPTKTVASEFTRVVIEIPTRVGFDLPGPIPSDSDLYNLASKHPSGMPLLARRLYSSERTSERNPDPVPKTVLSDLQKVDVFKLSTPTRVLLPKTANRRFKTIADVIDSRASAVAVRAAYSVKTNPDRRLMSMARDHGLLAEVITQAELNHALNSGFGPERIVLNGPAQMWPEDMSTAGEIFAVFADSIERLQTLVLRPIESQFMGVRLQLEDASRFGISVQDVESFETLIELVGRLDHQHLALHFHVHGERVGTNRWWDLFSTFLYWGQAIEEQTGRDVECVDVGGGWFPSDLKDDFLPRLDELTEQAKSRLPSLHTLLVEPGKSLVQPAQAIISRVVEMRRRPNHGMVAVVDASIADIPTAGTFPRQVLAFGQHGALSLS